MSNHNRQPIPRSPGVIEPVELELIAIHELATHPELLQFQLLCMGGMAVASSVEAAIQPDV